jgi:hypothetical protein
MKFLADRRQLPLGTAIFNGRIIRTASFPKGGKNSLGGVATKAQREALRLGREGM